MCYVSNLHAPINLKDPCGCKQAKVANQSRYHLALGAPKRGQGLSHGLCDVEVLSVPLLDSQAPWSRKPYRRGLNKYQCSGPKVARIVMI